MNVSKILVGLFCGGTVGAILGISCAMCLGILMQWLHPGDPSAGSIAIIVIATAPVGCLLGAIVGGAIASRRGDDS